MPPEYKCRPVRNDEKTSTIPHRLRCKHRREPRREQCGWQLTMISAAASGCMTMRPMPGEQFFLSWRLSLHLVLSISRVCGHRWSKDMRFAAANTPPPALCSMKGERGTLLYHTAYFIIILIVSGSAIGRRTTGVVENRWPGKSVTVSQLIAGVSRKGSPSARSRRRQLSGARFFLG